MNEVYFVTQVIIVLLFSYGALRLGQGALTALVTVQALIANLFVLKQMNFLGFEVTCSDAFAVGSILGLNLLREYFGKEAAKKAISICFFFMIFFVAVSQVQLLFVPGPHDTAQFAYAKLLTPAPRLLLASLVAFFIVQHFDVRCFGWISRILPRSSFPLRSSLSLTISQFIDTILFSFLGLYGIVNSILDILLVSFLLKVCVIFTLGPLMALMRRWMPRV
ncbi:MAG: queuosine precursor transporter [Verrucomicrobia bacterium]|nr:queuosine precursor transporter [Verrucomicrobiota bacterium]